MPIVQITMIEGRSQEQKTAMYREVADALHRTLNAPLDNIRIMVYEVPPQHFSTAGVAKTGPSGAAPSPDNA